MGFRDRTGFFRQAGSVSEIADKVKLSSETVVRIAEVLNAVESKGNHFPGFDRRTGISPQRQSIYPIWRRADMHPSADRRGMEIKEDPLIFIMWISN